MVKKLLAPAKRQPLSSAKDEHGLILITIMVAVTAIILVGIAVLSATTSQYILTSRDTYTDNALYTAEAGIEQTIQQLNASSSFAGYTTPVSPTPAAAQIFINTPSEGYGYFTTSVATINATTKTITATGTMYSNSNSLTNPVSTRKVQVFVVYSSGSPAYGVLSGPGGLIIGGASNITGTAVGTGGQLTFTGGSDTIGTSSQPITLNVGDNACLVGGVYPSLCTGIQPISMTNGIGHIYGTVCATNQTSTSFGPFGTYGSIQPGSTGVGLVPGCTAPKIKLPTYNRDAQINAVTHSAGAGTEDCSGPLPVWDDKLQINGSLVINGSCTIPVSGNVYIDGSLTINGVVNFQNTSTSSTPPVILVDGDIKFTASATTTPNAGGVGMEFISFASSSGCTTAPPGSDCTLTNGALQASATNQTITLDGNTNMHDAIFYAYWGEIEIKAVASVGGLMGQTINLQQGSGSIIYGGGIPGLFVPPGWGIVNYQQVFP